MQWMIPILTSLVPALFIAIVTSILTVRLSLRRFHAERWWEFKAEAYSRIVEALHQLMEYHAAMSESSMTGNDIGDNQQTELSANYQKAYSDLRKATRIGAYIISDKVAAALDALHKRSHTWKRSDPPWKHDDAEFQAYQNALEEIRHLAKLDLKVP